MNEPATTDDVAKEITALRAEYDAAWFLEAMLSSDLECAYMAQDETAKRRVHRELDAVSLLKTRAGDRWFRAQRAAAPTFEQLLADPAGQFDGKGEVLASILAYQNATAATACACQGRLHPHCAEAAR